MTIITPHIVWQDMYSVNVKEIDEQHKKFVGILNEIYNEAISPISKDNLKDLLNELVSYALLHFKTEETYFDKFNYKLAEAHKEEHKKILARLESYVMLNAEGKDIAFELLDLIEDWLVNHLSNFDKLYTKCFNDNGLF